MSQDARTYHYQSAQPSHMHEVFMPPILARLGELKPQRILDLGCGNGSPSGMISDSGFDVEGCDPNGEGIQQALSAYPGISFTCLSIYDEPPTEWLGAFDVIVSTEVVEHLYDPRAMPRLAARLLKPAAASSSPRPTTAI